MEINKKTLEIARLEYLKKQAKKLKHLTNNNAQMKKFELLVEIGTIYKDLERTR